MLPSSVVERSDPGWAKLDHIPKPEFDPEKFVWVANLSPRIDSDYSTALNNAVRAAFNIRQIRACIANSRIGCGIMMAQALLNIIKSEQGVADRKWVRMTWYHSGKDFELRANPQFSVPNIVFFGSKSVVRGLGEQVIHFEKEWFPTFS